ncbi:unnamed protein product [Penicillium roqueforti FM164]|uniref:Uncharacterized protein n=1 Tax=Penicillium roqueforti (strain FM164) TaxID=1365484 RepID=W6QJQ0_PENRF|nr:unnamed protein product [Penicillium roqueforti FM164]
MHQVTHRSFPNLLEHYRHRGQDFLVWEAVKLSIGQVLRSRYSIDEGALAAIVWPGRVLATLSADTIFLTESSIVKIAGVEHSYQIDATEIDAVTLKLIALADMVQNLITRSSPGTKWSPKAQSLPKDLNRLSVNKLLRQAE